MKDNPVEHVRDILVQEVMNIEGSEFQNEAIDMDAISFAQSTVQQEPIYNTPEPFRQDEESALSYDSEDVKSNEVKSTLWQTLNDRTTSKKPYKDSSYTTAMPKIKIATDRMDLDYPDNSNSVNFYINQHPGFEPNNVFRPNLVPSVQDRAHVLNFQNPPQLTPENGMKGIQNPPALSVNGDKVMSPFLEAPPPPNSQQRPQPPQPRTPSLQWADPNGFIPSQLSNNGILSLSNTDDVSVVVTPISNKPNTIPMTVRKLNKPLQFSTTSQPRIMMPAGEKFTAQQIIRQQMENKRKKLNKQPDDMTAQSSDEFWLTLQSRGNENLQKMKVADLNPFNHMLFDTSSELNNLQLMTQHQDLLDSQSPKLQFENIIPPATKTTTPSTKMLMVTPSTASVQNQFLLQEQLRQKQIEEMNKPTEKGESSIQVFNPGSSGLQTVQGAVPLDNSDQMFSVGAGLVVGGGESSTISNMIPGMITRNVSATNLPYIIFIIPCRFIDKFAT